MAMPLRIDFVSDVACPWCVVGLRSLMKALDAVGDKVEAEIHFQPFELNPDMPLAGVERRAYRIQKFGILKIGDQSGCRCSLRKVSPSSCANDL